MMNRMKALCAAVLLVCVAVLVWWVENAVTEEAAGTVPTPAEDIAYQEPDPVQVASRIINCTITHYCCEPYEHICGSGDGLTAMGTKVVPGYTCAVDPAVIPLGSRVWVDYGDGVLHEYIAEDVGGAVNGAHVDLAVETHTVALEKGVITATVWWKE